MEDVCPHCGEHVVEMERWYPVVIARGTESHLRYLHRECAIREFVGSIAHQLGLCSCQGGPGLDMDIPGMSRRQSALMAARIFRERALKVFN